jgi:hypothetical protein
VNVYQRYVVEENDSILPNNNAKNVIPGFVLVQIPPQVLKYCVTIEDPSIITLIRNSHVLVMEYSHYKGGFPGDLKG